MASYVNDVLYFCLYDFSPPIEVVHLFLEEVHLFVEEIRLFKKDGVLNSELLCIPASEDGGRGNERVHLCAKSGAAP